MQEKENEKRNESCEGCWVWESRMNFKRCEMCKRNFGDMYIKVED